jgi:hypothetical protein
MKTLKILAVTAALSLIPSAAFAVTVSEVAGSIGGPDFADSIGILDEATSVSILTVSSLEGSDDRAPLDEALAAKAQDLETLRARVEQSDMAKQALEAQGMTAANVVGIGASGDGAVTLFVDDMAAVQGSVEGEITLEPERALSGFRAGETAADKAAAGHDPEGDPSSIGNY